MRVLAGPASKLILCACSTALLLPPPLALADFTGLQTVERTDLTPICQAPSNPEIPYKLDVCSVYAVFNNPGDRLISVGFSNGSTTDLNGFFQHPEVNVVYSPECADIPADPALVCDTFVTIGLECAPALPGLDGTSIDPDFDVNEFQFNGQVLGGWYNILPTNGQGTPDANGKVLIAQFSVKQNKDVSGTLTVFAKHAGSDVVTEFPLQAFDCFGGGGGGGESGGGSGPCVIWYVNGDKDPANGCTTWDDACPDLQKALGLASPTDQIWVAKATNPYVPDNGTGDRTATFQLITGVAIYGGFLGMEMNLSERDWLLNETILSGNIGAPGVDTDNSYHVVSACGVGTTAILDGFTITKGQADGTGLANQGGGVHIFGVACEDPNTPQIANCTFFDNYAEDHGGGVNDHGGATLTKCVFRENHSDNFAGGLYTHTSISSVVTNCDFYLNTAVNEGGGAYVKLNTTGPEPTFTDCTFSGNQAQQGGGMYCGVARSPTLTNCTFTDNSAGGRFGGGAMYIDVDGAPTISDSTFTDNFSKLFGLAYGGAIYILAASPIFSNCMFVGGSADRYGGAIASQGTEEFIPPPFGLPAHPQMINCTFIGNEVGNALSPALGGAIFADRRGSVTLTNCLFVGNHNLNAEGGAVGILAPTKLKATNCTFVANSATTFGGGIFLTTDKDTEAEMHNCVFWDNTDNGGVNDDESAQIHFTATTPTITYSDLMNLVQGGDFNSGLNIGNIGWDPGTPQEPGPHYPKFVRDPDPGPDGQWGTSDDDFGNLRLKPLAPCIDAASNLEVPPDVADLDNDENTVERTPRDLDLKSRFVDDPDTDDTGVDDQGSPPIPEVVDMGPYEFDPCGLCPTDTPVIGPNGAVGAEDLAYILGNWGPFSENPACNPECPAALVCIDNLVPIAGNEQIGAEDLAKVLGTWGPCCGDGICLQGLPGQPLGDETCGGPDECEDDCGTCP